VQASDSKRHTDTNELAGEAQKVFRVDAVGAVLAVAGTYTVGGRPMDEGSGMPRTANRVDVTARQNLGCGLAVCVNARDETMRWLIVTSGTDADGEPSRDLRSRERLAVPYAIAGIHSSIGRPPTVYVPATARTAPTASTRKTFCASPASSLVSVVTFESEACTMPRRLMAWRSGSCMVIVHKPVSAGVNDRRGGFEVTHAGIDSEGHGP